MPGPSTKAGTTTTTRSCTCKLRSLGWKGVRRACLADHNATKWICLGPELVYMILQWVGESFTHDVGLKRRGQQQLAKVCRASSHWYPAASLVLWKTPLVYNFESFVQVIRWQARVKGTRWRPTVCVQRLVLGNKRQAPHDPCCSFIIPCPIIRLGRLAHDMMFRHLSDIFINCPHITDLSLSVGCDNRRPVSPTPSNRQVMKRSQWATMLRDGFAKLRALELVANPNFKEMADLLQVVGKGVGQNLESFKIIPYGYYHGRHGYSGDTFTNETILNLLADVAHSCPNLKVLVCPLPALHTEPQIRELSSSIVMLGRKLQTLSLPHLPVNSKPATGEESPKQDLTLARDALHHILPTLPNLTQLDIQGLRPTSETMQCLLSLPIKQLTTLLLDTDGLSRTLLVQTVRSFGPSLQTLALLSHATFPSHHLIDQIAKYCVQLVNLDLRHKPPDPTEPGLLLMPLPDEWMASLRKLLSKGRLKHLVLSWVPSFGYADAGLSLAVDFPDIVQWKSFPSDYSHLQTVHSSFL